MRLKYRKYRAGEMADIGTGISLSGKPNHSFESIIARRMAEDAMAQKVKGQRAAKASHDWRDYVDGLKFDKDKVHRLDYDNFTESNAKFVATAAKGLAEHGDGWLDSPEALELRAQQQEYNKSFETRKNDFDKITNDFDKMSEAHDVYPEQKAIYDQIKTGDYKGLMGVANNSEYKKWGLINGGMDNNGRAVVSMTPTPKTDLQKQFKEGITENDYVPDDSRKVSYMSLGSMGGQETRQALIPMRPNDGIIKNKTGEILSNPVALMKFKRDVLPTLSKEDQAAFNTPVADGLSDDETQIAMHKRAAEQERVVGDWGKTITGNRMKGITEKTPPPTAGEKEANKATNVQYNVHIPPISEGGTGIDADVRIDHNAKKVLNVSQTGEKVSGLPHSFGFIPTATFSYVSNGTRKNMVEGEAITIEPKIEREIRQGLWLKAVKAQFGNTATLSQIPNADGAMISDAAAVAEIDKLKPSDDEVSQAAYDSGKAQKITVFQPYESVRGAMQGSGINTSFVDKELAKVKAKDKGAPSSQGAGKKKGSSFDYSTVK